MFRVETPVVQAVRSLVANGYGSRQEWLADWRDARGDEFSVLGSRDETGGCQLCVATVADDGTLTLRCGCRISWLVNMAGM